MEYGLAIKVLTKIVPGVGDLNGASSFLLQQIADRTIVDVYTENREKARERMQEFSQGLDKSHAEIC